MNLRCKNKRRVTFTVMELLVTVVVLAILAALILPAMSKARSGPGPINCASNLKQIGIVFRVWEGDYGNVYPQRYYSNQPGEMQFVNATNLFRYFQVMSNEINNTKVLVCPQDKERTPAPSAPILTTVTSATSSVSMLVKNFPHGFSQATATSPTARNPLAGFLT